MVVKSVMIEEEIAVIVLKVATVDLTRRVGGHNKNTETVEIDIIEIIGTRIVDVTSETVMKVVETTIGEETIREIARREEAHETSLTIWLSILTFKRESKSKGQKGKMLDMTKREMSFFGMVSFGYLELNKSRSLKIKRIRRWNPKIMKI